MNRLHTLFSLLAVGSLTACTAAITPTEVPPTPTALPTDGSPPPASLEIDGATQTAGVGTYCWTSDTTGMCVDKIGLPTTKDPLTTTSPVNARLALPLPEAPTQLQLSVFPATEGNEVKVNGGGEDFLYWMPAEGLNRELALQSSQEITLELDHGLYVFYVFAVWEEKGDVSYGFLVEVQ
jgi:hypothetical protein